jgi:hypothetical protein
LVKFSVAKVTIFYFGAKGVGAFCEPASGETEGLFYNPQEALGRRVTKNNITSLKVKSPITPEDFYHSILSCFKTNVSNGNSPI